ASVLTLMIRLAANNNVHGKYVSLQEIRRNLPPPASLVTIEELSSSTWTSSGFFPLLNFLKNFGSLKGQQDGNFGSLKGQQDGILID
ncbi:MAG: hypothetical protein MJA29_06530, partial [Candidatus Omnitrophica bacterium]|nr:hypothetical protein [Candidatus Omnitrophota bacterium]